MNLGKFYKKHNPSDRIVVIKKDILDHVRQAQTMLCYSIEDLVCNYPIKEEMIGEFDMFIL
ncbi:hypothetical protein D3C87_2177530 [compost metagenome]